MFDSLRSCCRISDVLFRKVTPDHFWLALPAA